MRYARLEGVLRTEGTAMTYSEILNDPCAPTWARELARLLPTKDPVDVLGALRVLTQAARAEFNRVTGKVQEAQCPRCGGETTVERLELSDYGTCARCAWDIANRSYRLEDRKEGNDSAGHQALSRRIGIPGKGETLR